MAIVGIVGGGQLARMTHQAAIALGIHLRFLAEDEADPAPAVSRWTDLGSPLRPDDLARFAATVDVVTFDHEVVDLGALADLESAGASMFPRPDTLRLVADKAGMRGHLSEAGFPVPRWAAVRSADEFEAVLDGIEGPLVLKLSHGGYDGRGVFPVHDAVEAREVSGPILAAGHTLIVEPLLDLDAELAVLVARRPTGDLVVYDPVTTIQVDGMCREVVAPAAVPAEAAATARALGAAIAESVDVVGILAIELFLVGGELLVNELAARPHNTGHHTIDAAVTSQFENHLRAVLDLPLGDPTLRSPAAMVNVVGPPDGSDPRDRLSAGLAADPGGRIHLYGKTSRPGRKLGHVTVCADEVPEARRRAAAVATALGTEVDW